MMANDPTASVQSTADPLQSLLSYCERETARRAAGTHALMTRLRDDELGALRMLLQREVGADPAQQTGAAS